MKSVTRYLAFIFGITVFIWVSFPLYITQAQVTRTELTGWAWSENIGWISFNSKNCDANGNGFSDGTPGCPLSGTSMTLYGVTRQSSSGNLAGYAWSENIGWISFNPPGPYPGNPDRPSRIRDGQAADGWFRACAGTINGNCASASRSEWDGWMKFNSGGNYGSGVTIGGAGNDILQGFAWGSDVMGWISFNSKNCDADGNGFSDGTPGCPSSGTSIPPYQVSFVQVTAGSRVTNLSADTTSSAVVCSSAPAPTISWTYTNRFGLSQGAYQIQVATDSGFTNIIGDTGPVLSSNSSNVPAPGTLNYDTRYYYRVRAWDSNYPLSSPSSYVNDQFRVRHQGPAIGFTWTPQKPVKGANAVFTDTTTLTGGATFQSRSWTFPSTANPRSSNISPVTVVLRDSLNPVTLSVTDSDNLTCSLQKTVTVTTSIPNIKEVK